jgi:hypothetical protein
MTSELKRNNRVKGAGVKAIGVKEVGVKGIWVKGLKMEQFPVPIHPYHPVSSSTSDDDICEIRGMD